MGRAARARTRSVDLEFWNSLHNLETFYFRMTDLVSIISSGASLNDQISSLETQAG